MNKSDPSTWFQNKRSFPTAAPFPASNLPQKVFVENDGPMREYFDEPSATARIGALLDGYYSPQNYLELFYSLPEIYAPIHEIASRVADANWQLVKTWGEKEVDKNDATFNRLFSQPNVLQSHRQLIYLSVCHEILLGKVFWYLYKSFLGDSYKDILTWTALPAQSVRAVYKRGGDFYTSTQIEDLIQDFRLPIGNGKDRIFEPQDIMMVVNPDLSKAHDVNKAVSLIKGADKAIRNLIPVYEARGIIYIKRGAIGWMVAQGKDQNGPFNLTEEDIQDMEKEQIRSHGITGNKMPFGISKKDVRFERTSMSIQELQPFTETYADAQAIYATLRVPSHLIPSEKKSTFDNADADMKAFYQDVIIPWAKRYAQVQTARMKTGENRRVIFPDYSHIDVLQEDKKQKADADKAAGSTWLERWKNGACTLNEWIADFKGTPGVGPIYDKKIFELTPEEREQVSTFLNPKAIKNEPTQENTGTQGKSATDKLKVA